MTLPKKLEYFYLILVTLYHGQKGCHCYDPEASITGLYTGPYFDPLAPRNLTAHLDDRAVLPCTVRQLGDKSVSWVRMRDADILTVDRYTFVSDERFEAHYSPPQETWNLVIKYVQERDAGQYECQVSTEPKMSQLFNLRVVVPRVSMEPPGDRYVKAGSKVRIDCQITDVVQQPDYIFWYHDGIRVLENQDSNLDVNVKKTGEESLVSTLTISRVRRDESGNYTCMPSNLHGSSVLLHVLNEEHPEAMKDGRNASCKMEQPIYLFLLFVLCTAFNRLFNSCSFPNEVIGKGKNLAVKRKYQSTFRLEEKAKLSQKDEARNEIIGEQRLQLLTEIILKINQSLGFDKTITSTIKSTNQDILDKALHDCVEFSFDNISNNKTNIKDEIVNKHPLNSNKMELLNKNKQILLQIIKQEIMRNELKASLSKQQIRENQKELDIKTIKEETAIKQDFNSAKDHYIISSSNKNASESDVLNRATQGRESSYNNEIYSRFHTYKVQEICR